MATMMDGPSVKTRYIVVVQIDDFHEIELPLNAFPADLQEGSVVDIEISLNEQATHDRQGEVRDIQDRLRKRDRG